MHIQFIHLYTTGLSPFRCTHIWFIPLYYISLILIQFMHTQFLYSYIASLTLVQIMHRTMVWYFQFYCLARVSPPCLPSIQFVYTNRILFHLLFSYIALWLPLLMISCKLLLHFEIHGLHPSLFPIDILLAHSP